MDTMGVNDGARTVPISVELVPGSDADPAASRIPGAVGTVAIALAAVAAFFAAEDGAGSVYNDPAALRAGGSCGTYVPASEPEVDSPAFFDSGGADGEGD